MKIKVFTSLILLPVVVLLGSCASSNKPKAIEGLESSSKLEPSPEYPHSLIYKMEGVDFKKYTKFLINPVEIYKGKDAIFKGVPEADQAMVADFVKSEFERVLKKNYEVVEQPGPGVLQMKFTLAGIQLTQPALATITHFSPVGLVMNLGNSAAGAKGSFMGSVIVSGELFDSENNTMVAAFLTKRSPNAMDVTTTFSGIQAAKTSVTEMAERFGEVIDKIQGKVPKD